MPKVTRKKKIRGRTKGDEYRCNGCSEPITPGQFYFQWAFRYGGIYRRHVEHGYPKPSMLTQSKLGEVYAGIEDVEDVLASETFEGSDVTDALANLASVCTDIASEYEAAAEPFGGQGPNQEYAEQVQEFGDDVEQLSIDECPEGEDVEAWRDEVRSEVESVLGNAP